MSFSVLCSQYLKITYSLAHISQYSCPGSYSFIVVFGEIVWFSSQKTRGKMKGIKTRMFYF